MNAVEDLGNVVEEISSGRLTIHQKPALPDLHVEPVYRDSLPGGQFGWRQHVVIMGPSSSWLTYSNTGGMPDSWTVIGRTPSSLLGRTMPLACEDGGDLIVIQARAREGEHTIARFGPSRQLGDSVDPSRDRKVGHAPPHQTIRTVATSCSPRSCTTLSTRHRSKALRWASVVVGSAQICGIERI